MIHVSSPSGKEYEDNEVELLSNGILRKATQAEIVK